MSGLKIVTGPAVEPISRVEARNHLRLDEDVDDSQVRIYIQAAVNWAENYTGRSFINRTLKMYLDGAREVDSNLWEGVRTGPSNPNYVNYLELGATPVSSVTVIKYFADDDTETTWAASNYYVDNISEPAKIVLRSGGTYPTDLRSNNGIEITFVAGYGTSASDVPEAIRVAILQYMTYLYEHRGDFEDNTQPPSVIRSLLDPYRVLRFSTTPYENKMKVGMV